MENDLALKMEAFFAEATAIAELGDRGLILTRTCEAAVKLLDVDHSGLVVFEGLGEDGEVESGKVIAEYPVEFGAVGQVIRVRGVELETEMVRQRKVVEVADLTQEVYKERLGEVRTVLIDLNIRALLIVPIVCGGRVIASFSVDRNTTGDFTIEQILICKLLALSVGGALDKVRSLDLLNEAAAKLTGAQDVSHLVTVVEEFAKDLVGAQEARFLRCAMTGQLLPFRDPPLGASIQQIAQRVMERRESFLVEVGLGGAHGGELAAQDVPRVGVLVVRWHASQTRHPDTGRLLSVLAHFAQTAFLQYRARRLNTATERMERLSQEDALPWILSEACEAFINFFEADACRAIVWADWEKPGPIEAELIRPEDPAMSSIAPICARLARDYASTGITPPELEYAVETAAAVPDWLVSRESLSGRAILIPLVADRVGMGALVLSWQRGGQHEFDSRELRQAFAERLTRAILGLRERRRRTLMEELRQEQRKLRVREAASKELLATGSLGEDIARSAAQIVRGAGASLFGITGETRRLYRLAGYRSQDFIVEGRDSDLFPPGLLKGGRAVWLELKEGGAWSGYREAGCLSIVVVPIRMFDAHAHLVLIVEFREPGCAVNRTQLDVLDFWGAWSGAIFSVARLTTGAGLTFAHAGILERFAMFSFMPDKKLQRWQIAAAGMTAVTAAYGLGFHRAVLLEENQLTHTWKATAAVGQTEQADATAAWAGYERGEVNNYDTYLDELLHGVRFTTPLQAVLDSQQVTVPSFSCISFQGDVPQAKLVAAEDIPTDFKQYFRPGPGKIAVIPLQAAGSTWKGILIADRKFTIGRVTEQELDALAKVGSILASALHTFDSQGRNGLPALPLNSKPQEFLDALRNQAQAFAPAPGAIVVIFDTQGKLLSGPNLRIPVEVLQEAALNNREVRLDGWQDVQEAVCLPMATSGRVLALLVMTRPEGSAAFELSSVKSYLDLCAQSFLTLLHARDMERLSAAADRLATATTPDDVEQVILQEARSALMSEGCALWPVDPETRDFRSSPVLLNVVTDNPERPVPGELVFNARDNTYSECSEAAQSHVGLVAESAQAVALRSDNHTTLLGVLLVTYRNARRFSEEERKVLKRLADIAGPALSRAHWAGLVAGPDLMAVRARVPEPGPWAFKMQLDAIAQHACKESNAPCAVLFSFDSGGQRFHHPPGTANLIYPKRAAANSDGIVAPESFVYRLLEQDEPTREERVDIRYPNSRFRRDEGIRSFAAFPLRAEGTRIGILFLNYRAPMEFGQAEMDRLRIVAQRIAVALWAAQRVSALDRLAFRARSLSETMDVVLTSENPGALYKRVLEAAQQVLEVRHANVVALQEDKSILLRKAIGWELQDGYIYSPTEAYHARYTITSGQRTEVFDFADSTVLERFPIAELIRRHHIRSGVGVPITRGGRVTGAILVHSVERRQFTETEITFLEALADACAFAERRFEHLDSGDDRVHEWRTVAHRIRDPLYCVDHILLQHLSTFSNMLTGPQVRRLKLARTWLTEIDRMIENILSGETVPAAEVPQVTEIEKPLQEVERIYDEWAKRVDVGFKRDRHNIGGVSVAMNSSEFRLLLMNLLSEAVRVASQAAGEKREVALVTTRKDKTVRIEVRAPWKSTALEPEPYEGVNRDPLSLRVMVDILSRTGARMAEDSSDMRALEIPAV
jgi:GAF domain-containing protein